MIRWDPETDAANRQREITIAVALIDEATKTPDPQVARRLNVAALLHLKHLTEPAAAAA